MLTLVLIGLLGGLITGVSPCILPVLPVVFFAAGAKQPDGSPPGGQDTGDSDDAGGAVAVQTATEQKAERKIQRARNRRPYAVIGGLVFSFTLFTLLGSLLIKLLGLPDDILRTVGLVVLTVVGLSLLIPKLEQLLEKPFAKLPQRQVNPNRGGFGLGMALGLLYVPCAGPVLAAITIAAANGKIGVQTVALTVAFAIGAALPLLVFALAGAKLSTRIKFFRENNRLMRSIGGVVMLLLAAALYFNLPDLLQRSIPNYTQSLQEKVENNKAISDFRLSNLADSANSALSKCDNNPDGELRQCGKAPNFQDIEGWFNTPGNKPLSISGLRGKVVLVDFWAYSCINCQRSTPHIEELYNRYRNAGLEVIGMHSPEFAFEKVPANVMEGAKKLGITYPVALDTDSHTFTAYRNQYWPARYLIDASGNVRYIKLGEGDYGKTETLIRDLLTQANPKATLPAPGNLSDEGEQSDRTPETYLGLAKVLPALAPGSTQPQLNKDMVYRFPRTIPLNKIAYDGHWNFDYDKSTAGQNARIRLHYTGTSANMVLAGNGTATVSVDGGPTRTITVSGTPNLHRLVTNDTPRNGVITVGLSPGLQAYTFTFD